MPLPLLDLEQFMFGCTGLDSVLFVRYKTYGTVIAVKHVYTRRKRKLQLYNRQ